MTLNETDLGLLTSIAEHRVLSVFQLAALHLRNPNSLRRRLRLLRNGGLIMLTSRGTTGGQGRPENLVSLTESGVERLKGEGIIPANVPIHRATSAKLSCLEHELLVNDFRVQLTRISRMLPAIRSRYFSPTSPLLPRLADDRPLVRERVRLDDGAGSEADFIPDGVFATTHQELGKTLLFFLEIDRGTEPLTRRHGPAQTIRQKIFNYQILFDRECYQHYVKILERPLRGFRVLFVTDGTVRLAALCRLVREMPPSDFIWLTDRDRMSTKGIWAPIWVRGGRDTEPLESILGSRMPKPCPPPDAA